MNSVIAFFKGLNLKKIILLLLAPLLLMWNDLSTMFIGLMVLVTIDLQMGIKVHNKLHKQKFILWKRETWGVVKSKGLRQTASKIKDYVLIIVGVWTLNHKILKNPLSLFEYNVEEMVIITLAVVELWSMGENFKKLRGYNILEYVFRLFKNKDINKTIEDIRKNQNNTGAE